MTNQNPNTANDNKKNDFSSNHYKSVALDQYLEENEKKGINKITSLRKLLSDVKKEKEEAEKDLKKATTKEGPEFDILKKIEENEEIIQEKIKIFEQSQDKRKEVKETLLLYDYAIQKGDTLSQIASWHGVSLKKLLTLNPKYKPNPDLIYPDQILMLPSDKKDEVENIAREKLRLKQA